MQVSGKWLILVVVLLAVLGGGFSWWHRWHATHRSATWWGPERVAVLRTPDVVIARELHPAGPVAANATESSRAESGHSSESRAGGASTEKVRRQREISEFGGVTHLSYALLQDVNFDWEATPPTLPPAWRFELHFQSGPRVVEVRFSGDFHWLAQTNVGRGESMVATGPAFQHGLKRYFEDVFSSPASERAAQ